MANGTTLKGEWKDDLKVGDFIIKTLHSPIIFTARYLNGKLIPGSTHYSSCEHERAKKKKLDHFVTTTITIPSQSPPKAKAAENRSPRKRR